MRRAPMIRIWPNAQGPRRSVASNRRLTDTQARIRPLQAGQRAIERIWPLNVAWTSGPAALSGNPISPPAMKVHRMSAYCKKSHIFGSSMPMRQSTMPRSSNPLTKWILLRKLCVFSNQTECTTPFWRY